MLLGDLPVRSLGTASVCGKDLDEEIRALFGYNCYEVKLPSTEARSKFFSQLVDAAVAVPRRRAVSGSEQKEVLPELPKAPNVVKGPRQNCGSGRKWRRTT
ncbi:hypothetical protein M758_7G053900 [Ceratodon purpureus]|uniref:Uncharacterized protein n=1 Tax=Ceratodon purpureus TaxID=3225 RepID=A0A8T0H7K1_CERPU|nr:hypothetical protein KC19_7G056600 [Ceratodon purpureus]KAG0610288.1 hypothetical protein M758_7G053900 [Ceratodon purpureus]